ncbi:KAP family P-loop NTPase fold protein [Roseivirga echinicomitans]|uniref:KAP family P-loop NTPase fold protein n=1 Tax=Roseivirga echinicomitans TaxID=296218 RepID=UPI00155F239F|nr:P-loop NTPase fold protein [Roseivirga echinicomitans]
MLSRKNYAQKISNHIHNTSLDHSFALALSSEWGSGKTSFVNLIIEHFQELDKSAIVIRFNPKLSQNPKGIITDFFKEFETSLAPYRTRVGSLIKEYSNSITVLKRNTVVENINDLVDAFNPPKPLRQLYEEIDGIITSIGRKILIEIDDIDRLDKDEVIEVFRLIRNTGSFTNTFFLAAFDREYVTTALKDINEHNTHQYLHKIFQAEISLPGFDRIVLRDKLIECLKETIRIEEDLNELKNLFSIDVGLFGLSSMIGSSMEIPSNTASSLITNLRDVIRLANNIKLTYDEDIRREVDINDFFRIQVLKVKFARELDYFYANHNNILMAKSVGNDTFLEYPGKDTEGSEQIAHGRKSFETFVEKPQKANVKLFLKEVQSLFQRNSKEANNLSIQWLSRFNIIFGVNLFGNYFSETTFQKYLNELTLTAEEYYQDISSKNLKSQLLGRLSDIEKFTSPTAFKRVYSLWFHMLTSGFLEIRDIKERLLSTSELSSLTSEIDDYKFDDYRFMFFEWLNSIKDVNRRSYLIQQILLQIIYDKEKSLDIIPFDDFIQQNLIILETYLSNNLIDDLALTIHSRCTESVEEQSRLIKINEKANELLRKKIIEEPESYLEHLIIPLNQSETGREYAFHAFTNQVFDSQQNFEDWLQRTTSAFPKKKLLWKIYSYVKANEQLKGFKFEDYEFNRPSWVPEPEIKDEDYQTT